MPKKKQQNTKEVQTRSCVHGEESKGANCTNDHLRYRSFDASQEGIFVTRFLRRWSDIRGAENQCVSLGGYFHFYKWSCGTLPVEAHLGEKNMKTDVFCSNKPVELKRVFFIIFCLEDVFFLTEKGLAYPGRNIDDVNSLAWTFSSQVSPGGLNEVLAWDLHFRLKNTCLFMSSWVVTGILGRGVKHPTYCTRSRKTNGWRAPKWWALEKVTLKTNMAILGIYVRLLLG